MIHRAAYAIEYEGISGPFYLKSIDTRPLVVHPRWWTYLAETSQKGISIGNKLYKNSNLRKFPRLEGPEKEPCGCTMDVFDTAALEAILAKTGATVSIVSAFSDVGEDDIEVLKETERQALKLARIGQGEFRFRLMEVWNERCAVTGSNIQALLRASHIKPWRESNNSERLNPENGLLLMANLDAAFDAMLISFSDEGTMLFSKALRDNPHQLLGLKLGAALSRRPSAQQQNFLQYHRNEAKRRYEYS